ncbi:putative uncharacterized protein DDB_G0282499 [Gordionus sp. m RMFG-2023]|uniref:putative uncharacterized protein DDB_G0282499 n=1 Tax=Gordionus sp. m RMFG-2023 TaxID=3053472 RepID=UPI0031FC6A52
MTSMPQTSVEPFPMKLYRIINTCQTGEIDWAMDGKSILINFPSFEKRYLDSYTNQYFKKSLEKNDKKETKVEFNTKQISSFIRQLNLYGFKKISKLRKKHEDVVNRGQIDFPQTTRKNHGMVNNPEINGNNYLLFNIENVIYNDSKFKKSKRKFDDELDYHEYFHKHFIRGHPELLETIKRTSLMNNNTSKNGSSNNVSENGGQHIDDAHKENGIEARPIHEKIEYLKPNDVKRRKMQSCELMNRDNFLYNTADYSASAILNSSANHNFLMNSSPKYKNNLNLPILKTNNFNPNFICNNNYLNYNNFNLVNNPGNCCDPNLMVLCSSALAKKDFQLPNINININIDHKNDNKINNNIGDFQKLSPIEVFTSVNGKQSLSNSSINMNEFYDTSYNNLSVSNENLYGGGNYFDIKLNSKDNFFMENNNSQKLSSYQQNTIYTSEKDLPSSVNVCANIDINHFKRTDYFDINLKVK